MTMKRPKISVIVPVYNAGKFLAPCIRSVLAQTFTDFELILVDDASTDASLEVCQSFADSRIRILKNKENQGLSLTRNVGIDNAQGRYLTFLDADDLLNPRFLEKVIQLAGRCGSQIVATAFTHDYQKWVKCPCESRYELFDSETAIAKGLYQSVQLNSACGKLYDAKLFNEFRYRKVGYEDLDSFYKLFFKANKITYYAGKMYFYRMNPASYIHTFTPERAVVLDVTERIVEYMTDNCPRLVPAAHDRALSAAFNVFNLIAKNKAGLPDIVRKCKLTIKKYRKESLLNPKVRLKNKMGILVTYIGGFRLLKFMAQLSKNS